MISEVKNIKSYKCIWINGKQKRLHRYIMELHLKRELLPHEIVHHIDGDKWNNAISNLELTNRKDHVKMHYKEIQCRKHSGKEISCTKCGEKRYMRPVFLNKPGKVENYLCRKCYENGSSKAS